MTLPGVVAPDDVHHWEGRQVICGQPQAVLCDGLKLSVTLLFALDVIGLPGDVFAGHISVFLGGIVS